MYYDPKNISSARDTIDHALAMAMPTLQTIVATTLGNAPGFLVIARDMFLNVQLIPVWQSIARLYEHHVYEH